MDWRARAVLGAGVGLLLAWVAWGVYVTRRTERVPYEPAGQLDGVELRRYPRTVRVETTASSNGAAFGRLFRYLSGANRAAETVAMTAPVATRGSPRSLAAPTRAVLGGGASVAMTAPVRTERAPEGVTMSFYLPASYTPETAPTPTDDGVSLAVDPPRTVAVRRFSWYATRRRVRRARRRLLDALADEAVEVLDDPVLLQYNDPWTPPFLRRNEVLVPIRRRRDPSGHAD